MWTSIFYEWMLMHFKIFSCMIQTLAMSMVHSIVLSSTMASLDHLVTDLQEQVARQKRYTNKQDMWRKVKINITDKKDNKIMFLYAIN